MYFYGHNISLNLEGPFAFQDILMTRRNGDDETFYATTRLIEQNVKVKQGEVYPNRHHLFLSLVTCTNFAQPILCNGT